jgi:hypothetical protein
MVNVFGRRAKDGFAQRPFDNVGVEYGRKALAAGVISPAQFVDLNAKIGAADIDYNPTVERTAADPEALERVYRSGAVDQADNLDQVAIIDLRGPDPGAFHDVYRTYVMRARLEREHGTAANQILWRGFVPLLGDANYADEAILAVDRWLAAVEKDPRAVPLARKIIEDKPADIVDRCTNGAGLALPAAACDATVQAYSDPRIEAGMALTDDTIKCELRPLRRSDYGSVQFSDAQWETLRKTFPEGVCDYSRPGVNRVPTQAWQTYQDRDGNVIYGGRPLGAVPASQAVPALAVTGSRSCVRRGRLRLRLRSPSGEGLREARVYVNGRRRAVLRGRRVTAPLELRGLPRTARVKVVAVTRSGHPAVVERRYRACAAKRRRA